MNENGTLILEFHTEEATESHETEIDLSISKEIVELRQNSTLEIVDSDQSVDEDSPEVTNEESANKRPTTAKRGFGRSRIN